MKTKYLKDLEAVKVFYDACEVLELEPTPIEVGLLEVENSDSWVNIYKSIKGYLELKHSGAKLKKKTSKDLKDFKGDVPKAVILAFAKAILFDLKDINPLMKVGLCLKYRLALLPLKTFIRTVLPLIRKTPEKFNSSKLYKLSSAAERKDIAYRAVVASTVLCLLEAKEAVLKVIPDDYEGSLNSCIMNHYAWFFEKYILFYTSTVASK